MLVHVSGSIPGANQRSGIQPIRLLFFAIGNLLSVLFYPGQNYHGSPVAVPVQDYWLTSELFYRQVLYMLILVKSRQVIKLRADFYSHGLPAGRRR
jgi:hypothetical protein